MAKNTQTIHTLTPKGKVAVEALVKGQFGLHKYADGSGYAVTHVPSGLRCANTNLRRDALRALDALAEMECPDPAYTTKINAIFGLRIKALLTPILKSWEIG